MAAAAPSDESCAAGAQAGRLTAPSTSATTRASTYACASTVVRSRATRCPTDARRSTYLESLHRDQDRLALLGEQPDKRKLFSEFAKEYLEYLRLRTTRRPPTTAACGWSTTAWSPTSVSSISARSRRCTWRRSSPSAERRRGQRPAPAPCRGRARCTSAPSTWGWPRRIPTIEEGAADAKPETPLPLMDAAEQQRLLDAIPESRRRSSSWPWRQACASARCSASSGPTWTCPPDAYAFA